jgi:hypothetical protein
MRCDALKQVATWRPIRADAHALELPWLHVKQRGGCACAAVAVGLRHTADKAATVASNALTNREDWLVQQRAGVRRNATPSRSVILRCTTGSSGLRSSARRLLRSAGRRQRRAARRKGTPRRLHSGNTVERGTAARHEDPPWPVHTTSKGHTHHVERPNTRMTCAKGIMVWFD